MTPSRSPRSALVIVTSDRAASGVYDDTTGEYLLERLETFGYDSVRKVIVADEVESISRELKAAIQEQVDLIITTGGTGIAIRDVTPEATRPLLERELPGIAESIRAVGRSHVATADLSRGLAGISGSSLIVNLAGSMGAVRDGIEVILKLAGHVHDQLGENPIDHTPLGIN